MDHERFEEIEDLDHEEFKELSEEEKQEFRYEFKISQLMIRGFSRNEAMKIIEEVE